MLADPLFTVSIIAVLAVLIILMLGLGGFATGGKFNQKNANKLMRYRIIAQFVAVVLIVMLVWLRGDAG